MDNKALTTGITLFVIAGFLGLIVLGSTRESRTVDTPKDNSTRVEGENTDTDEETERPQQDRGDVDSKPHVTYYYGITCPYCRDVEEYIDQNSLDEKINIDKREVYENRSNQLELQKAARECGLDTRSIGVPFLLSDEQCFIGLPDIVGELDRIVEEN